VLPALALNDGIIHCDIIEGAFDTNTFYSFISHLLDEMQPYPAPKSVVVMDNCRIHKHPEILRLIESRYALICTYFALLDLILSFSGMRYEFLPPYSPDYNPIELAFSAMKYHLRRNGEYIRMAMNEMSMTEVTCVLLEALYQISPSDVFGWFRHCNYV
jgi:transposase